MTYKLMPHQKEVVEIAKKQSLALFHSCGCGKTLSTIEIIKHYGGKTLVVCPLTLIENAWMVDCKKFAPELDVVSLWSKKPADRRERLQESHDVYVVNFEGFKGLFDVIQRKKFDTIIVDECFVGDTLIETPTGHRKISDICIEDKILNCTGEDEVVGINKKTFKDCNLSLTTIDGSVIISSCDHLYLTINGWVKAKNLKQGDGIVNTKYAMRFMQKNTDSKTSNEPFKQKEEDSRFEAFLRNTLRVEMENDSTRNSSQNSQMFFMRKSSNLSTSEKPLKQQEEESRCETFLWKILFCKMENGSARNKSENVHKKDSRENIKSQEEIFGIRRSKSYHSKKKDSRAVKNVRPCCEGKSVGYTESYESYASRQGWKRDWANETSEDFAQEARRDVSWCEMGNGAYSSDRNERKEEKGGRSTKSLQNRYSVKRVASSYRGGWTQPQGNCEEGERQKKGKNSFTSRVESVEVLKSRDPIFDRYRNEEGGVVLYDLKIKKHPSFSVNGVVVHNSSKMKSVTSAITRSLLAMAGIKLRKRGGRVYPVNHIIPNRYCLSGTPAPNSDLEYYAQLKFITGPGDECFSDNFYSFRRLYAYGIPLGVSGQQIWKPIPSMRSNLLEAMKPYTDVVRIEDVLDLLPQKHIVRTVDLTTPERVAYDTFKNDLVLRFKDETVLASTALVAVMKLRQLTSGFMYGNDGLHWIGNTKLNELLEVLEEIGGNKVLIWANFREEIEMLNKAIPGSKTLYGGTKDKNDSIEDFRDGDCKVLIANPMSAAHGLTFTNCYYNILFSLSYSYEYYEQLIHRTYRYGQKEGVIYYYIIAKNSIDEVVYNAVQSKGDMSSAALQFLKGK